MGSQGLFPEGNYEGRLVRIDMRGGGFLWFDIQGTIVKIPLRGFVFGSNGPLLALWVQHEETKSGSVREAWKIFGERGGK